MCPKNWWAEINGVTDEALEDYYEGKSVAVQVDEDEEDDESD